MKVLKACDVCGAVRWLPASSRTQCRILYGPQPSSESGCPGEMRGFTLGDVKIGPRGEALFLSSLGPVRVTPDHVRPMGVPVPEPPGPRRPTGKRRK